MIKWRHAAEGLTRLLWDPFDFFGAMVFFDAFADTPALRAAYERMLRDLTPEARAQLRALTLEPVDVPALLALPEGTLGRASTSAAIVPAPREKNALEGPVTPSRIAPWHMVKLFISWNAKSG